MMREFTLIRFAVNTLLFIACLLLTTGCGDPKPEPVEIPDHVAALDNLVVLEPRTAPALELVEDQEFGVTDEVIIGTIMDVAVDGQGRVYLADGTPGTGQIYVFRPDGSYLTTIGQYGRGPGDLLDTVEMKVRDEKLYVFHGMNGGQNISVFSTETFEEIDRAVMRREGWAENEDLAGMYPGNRMFILDEGYLMDFRWYHPSEPPEETRYNAWYRRSGDGVLVPEKLFELRAPEYFYPERLESIGGLDMQWVRESLIAVTHSDTIFTAWSDEYLIAVRNSRGDTLRTFYLPRRNSSLSMAGLHMDEEFNRDVHDDELPPDWPLLYDLHGDEQNRLWVLGITDEEEHYEGLVAGAGGDVLGTFRWPDERYRILNKKYLETVRDGYLYARMSDEETGLFRAVRYRLETVEGARFQ